MTSPRLSANLSLDELATWQRVRRYAVPRWMIERSAGHRRDGDWAAACAACHVDIAFELRAVADRYGAETADRLQRDLRHLVPDLVRWHLPRVLGGHATLVPDRVVILAAYESADHRDGTRPRAGRDPGPYLYLVTPPMSQGPQRLALRFGAVPPDSGDRVLGHRTEDWTACRHLWDARFAHQLRERVGGSPERAPFAHPDGTARSAAELPAENPGPGDPAALAEWITLLQDRGEVVAAAEAAGLLVATDPVRIRYSRMDPVSVLAGMPLDLACLEAETGHAGGGHRWRIGSGYVVLERTLLTRRFRIGPAERETAGSADVPRLPTAAWRRLPDLDLLRFGRIRADELHPLVAESLFPALPSGTAAGPPPPAAPARLRVRCRDGAWHQVGFGDGRFVTPHSEEEHRREAAMRAFGGAVSGCFAVEQTWTTGSGRLPRVLREQQRDLFQRAEQGDTPGVLALLDAGLDPRVRGSGGRNLLHLLPFVDHEPLLPRLLEAGLDLEARDSRQRTPLFAAANDRGSPELVRALLAAGARIDVTDDMGLSMAQVVRRYGRTDLMFLARRVLAEHPGVGEPSWDEHMDWREEEEGEAGLFRSLLEEAEFVEEPDLREPPLEEPARHEPEPEEPHADGSHAGASYADASRVGASQADAPHVGAADIDEPHVDAPHGGDRHQ